jgi:hypothetical protein
MELSECLAEARRKIVMTDYQPARRYGLRADHLTMEKINKLEDLVIWDTDEGEKKIGWKLSIIRHPEGSRVRQVWKLFFDGRISLAYEEPLGQRRDLKYQGKFVPASILFKDKES